jgi:hypothetical protein
MGEQVRVVTHADVTDDDIVTVLERIGPVDLAPRSAPPPPATAPSRLKRRRPA